MRFDYRLAPQIGARGRLGLIVLQSDETIEDEFRQILPDDDVAGFVARIPSGEEVSRETLAAMQGEMTAAARLMPRSVSFDVVGYGCTSASSVIGTGEVAQLIKAGCETRAVTDPVSALIAACRALGVSKLALLTPYAEEVSESLRQTLRQAGIDTPVFGSFNEPMEERVARIDPASIAEAAQKLGRDTGAEAVFLSCTNLRTFSILGTVEQSLGKPALSSNLALFWHMFALGGVSHSKPAGIIWDKQPG